eukprot:2017940-Rhodomonas_salina.1
MRRYAPTVSCGTAAWVSGYGIMLWSVVLAYAVYCPTLSCYGVLYSLIIVLLYNVWRCCYSIMLWILVLRQLYWGGCTQTVVLRQWY